LSFINYYNKLLIQPFLQHLNWIAWRWQGVPNAKIAILAEICHLIQNIPADSHEIVKAYYIQDVLNVFPEMLIWYQRERSILMKQLFPS
jgi:hypothetical protein